MCDHSIIIVIIIIIITMIITIIIIIIIIIIETESGHLWKLIELIMLCAHYQSPRNMRYHCVNRLYIYSDVFSCAMELLVTFLSKRK